MTGIYQWLVLQVEKKGTESSSNLGLEWGDIFLTLTLCISFKFLYVIVIYFLLILF